MGGLRAVDDDDDVVVVMKQDRFLASEMDRFFFTEVGPDIPT